MSGDRLLAELGFTIFHPEGGEDSRLENVAVGIARGYGHYLTVVRNDGDVPIWVRQTAPTGRVVSAPPELCNREVKPGETVWLSPTSTTRHETVIAVSFTRIENRTCCTPFGQPDDVYYVHIDRNTRLNEAIPRFDN